MLLNKKDFAAALEINFSTLRSHIKRNKIYTTGELIDTESELTINYIKNHTDRLGIDLTKYHRNLNLQLKRKIKVQLIDEVNIIIDNAVKSIKEDTANKIEQLVNDYLVAENKIPKE
ncbi:hypothetical protein [Maribacter sp. R86514]|uniref:hypothetical protein n=1 Tax=Maribacter sp. R86514 TaxID=3093854 RepID=UPI0037CAE15E